MHDFFEGLPALPDPADYFSGIDGPPPPWPRRVLLFLRKTRSDLRLDTKASRPHHRCVLVINLGTPGVLNVDGIPYPLRPGEAHLVLPYHFHTYHDLVEEEIRWLFVTFELDEEGELEPLKHTTFDASGALGHLLRNLCQVYLSTFNTPEKGSAVSFAAAAVIRHLLDTPAQPQPSTRAKPGAAALLSAILKHHRNDLSCSLGISGLAKRMGMSESRLRERFREAFGCGLGGFLREIRLHQAMAMIRGSSAPLSAVAAACGFDSHAAFTRSFRNWAGRPPQAFRHG